MSVEDEKDVHVNEVWEDLEEGGLYVYKQGELHEIETDPDDLMKKIRITPDAFSELSALQRRMRKLMQGYRPDISVLGSALIAHAAKDSQAEAVVQAFVLNMYKTSFEETR